MATPDEPSRISFYLGNAVLAIAAISLFFFGELWSLLGTGALFLWMTLVIVGVYLIWRDRDPGPPGPLH